MRKLVLSVQIIGVLLIAFGVAAFSIPVACVAVGMLLIAAGEVHG